MPQLYAGSVNEAVLQGMSRDEQALALYLERKEHFFNKRGTFLRSLQPLYDLYIGATSSRHDKDRLHVHIPFIFSILQSNVSRKAQVTFGSSPIVDFQGFSKDDAPIARKVASLVTAQLDDADSFTKIVDLYLSADLYGTGVCRVDWRNIQRYEKWRELEFDPFAGSEAEVVREGWVTRFDGPNWDVVDLQDFWLQPGVREIRDAMWAMHRYVKDLSWVRAAAAGGLFKKSAVSDLEKRGMTTSVADEFHTRRTHFRTMTDYEARFEERFAKPVVLVDMIGEVPQEMAPDGVKWRLITVANDRVVLRNVPFPYWHGRLDMIFMAHRPMRDPGDFYGVGKAQLVARMQYLANRIASQKAAAVDLGVEPMWLVNRLAGINTKNLVTRAGRIVGVDGPVDDTVIRPISPDLRGLQVAYTEIGQLWQWMQQGTGIIEDTIMGIDGGGSDRQTATEFGGRMQGALSRQGLEALLAEKEIVEPLGDAFRQLNQQFLTLPHAVRLIGSEAMINPVTGTMLPQEPTSIDLSDLYPDYKARAVGASQILGKQFKQSQVLTLLQAASSNPVAIQIINWASFFKYVFRTFDLPNTDEFFVDTAMPPIANAMAGTQGNPAEALMGAGDALDEEGGISPELLAALGGGV